MSEASTRLKADNLVEALDHLDHMTLSTRQLLNASRDGVVDLHVTYDVVYRRLTQDLIHVLSKMWREQA